MPSVRLTRWHHGMLAIPVIRAIREHTGLGLADTKDAIDTFLAGEQITLIAPTDAAAHDLVRALAVLHVAAELSLDL